MFGICFFMLKPPPQLFRSNVLATSSRREQAEKLFDRVRKAARITNRPYRPSVHTPRGNGRTDKRCPLFVRGLFADASGQNARLFCFRDKTQRNLTVIEIGPHRNGWKVFEGPGVEPVFLHRTKRSTTHRIARVFRSGEIRLLDSTGALERTIQFTEANRKL
jgi:hypothetical protein